MCDNTKTATDTVDSEKQYNYVESRVLADLNNQKERLIRKLIETQTAIDITVKALRF